VVEKVKNILKKREAKLFFMFLLLSFFAWFISSLSHQFQSNASFDLEFINPPDSMMLVSASKRNIDVKLDAVGFRFLLYNLNKPKMKINLSDAVRKGKHYFLSPNRSRRQIADQLVNGVELLDIGNDTLFFEFYGVISKKLPVLPVLDIEYTQNYLLDGEVALSPDSVQIKGPVNEIDSIRFLKTNKIILKDVNKDFSMQLKLQELTGLEKTTVFQENIEIKGRVSKFSEKIISVPITIAHLPKNTQAQTFPKNVDILVKASLRNLKRLSEMDFEVLGDYNTVKKGEKSIQLSITKKPAWIHDAELPKNSVDFILKRE